MRKDYTRNRSPSINRREHYKDFKPKQETSEYNNIAVVAQNATADYYQLNIENDMEALSFNDKRIIELRDDSSSILQPPSHDVINPEFDEI